MELRYADLELIDIFTADCDESGCPDHFKSKINSLFCCENGRLSKYAPGLVKSVQVDYLVIFVPLQVCLHFT